MNNQQNEFKNSADNMAFILITISLLWIGVFSIMMISGEHRDPKEFGFAIFAPVLSFWVLLWMSDDTGF